MCHSLKELGNNPEQPNHGVGEEYTTCLPERLAAWSGTASADRYPEASGRGFGRLCQVYNAAFMA